MMATATVISPELADLLQRNLPEIAELLKNYTPKQIVASVKARECVYKHRREYYQQNKRKLNAQRTNSRRQSRAKEEDPAEAEEDKPNHPNDSA